MNHAARRRHRRLTAGLLALSLSLAPTVAPSVTNSGPRLLLNAILLNGQPAGEAQLLQLADGSLLARTDDWRRWRLQIPDTTPLRFEGVDYHPLASASGYSAAQDAQTQTTALNFGAAAFASNRHSLGAELPLPPPAPRDSGGFLNYEAIATHRRPEDSAADTVLNAAVETGAFGRWGVATSQWIGLDLNEIDTASVETEATREIIRLDSSWRYDWPAEMQTLQFGDNVGKAGLWGRAARFGGVQWARNFATQPDFVSLPLPSVRGAATLPSTVDVYVDGIRRQRLDVPAGPFEIDSIPAVNSLGEVQVVVRDLLGREQLLRQSYLSGAHQLRRGLHDYAYEAGVQREDYGLRSDAYGPALASGLHRYGFSDALTGEARLELRAGGGRSAGLGAIAAVPVVGVVSAAAAYSHDDNGDGQLGLLAWQRIVRRSLSLGARAQFASRGFRQNGSAGGLAMPARTLSANAGFALSPRWHLGIGYVEQHYRDNSAGMAPGLEAATATLSARFGHAALALQLLQRLDIDDATTIALSLAMPLAPRLSSGASYRRGDNAGQQRNQTRLGLQRNPGSGEGYGYRLAVSADDSASNEVSAEAGLNLNAAYGSYALDAARYVGGSAYRASLTGGLATYAGQHFAARRIGDGFAIVDTGVGDVPVQLNSQPAARSNAAGIAIIPELQAYQPNQLRVVTDALPIDIEIESDTATAMPYYRSGTLVHFLLRQARGALIRLQRADGQAVRVGAWVELDGRGERFAVGRAGRAYVSGLQTGRNDATLVQDGQRCAIRIELPVDAGPQPELGPLQCLDAP